MSFDIPASIEPSVREYADSHHVSTNEALVMLIQAGLRASDKQDSFDHIFTSERIEELDRISRSLKSGSETFSTEQVKAHFGSK